MVELHIKRGDIIMVDLGECTGSEQSGVRPAIVIQNDIGNKFAKTTIIAPVTSTINKKHKFHLFLNKNKYNLKYHSVALLEQLRVIDKIKIERFLDKIKDDDMVYLERCLKVSVGLGD